MSEAGVETALMHLKMLQLLIVVLDLLRKVCSVFITNLLIAVFINIIGNGTHIIIDLYDFIYGF